MKDSYSIYDYLESILLRPAMYVGQVRLDLIQAHLDGYQMAMHNAEVSDVSEPDFAEFREFVKMKYEFPGSRLDWAHMILAAVISVDRQTLAYFRFDELSQEQHTECVQIFRELVEEFRCS